MKYKQTDYEGPLDKYVSENSDSKVEKIYHRPADEPLEITENGVNFVKGETIGWFEMGSTIVLIFEGPQNT